MSAVPLHYPQPLRNPHGFTLPSNFKTPADVDEYGTATLLTTLDGWDVWTVESAPGSFFSVRLSDLLVAYDVYDQRLRRLWNQSPEVPQSVIDFITAYCRLTLS